MVWVPIAALVAHELLLPLLVWLVPNAWLRPAPGQDTPIRWFVREIVFGEAFGFGNWTSPVFLIAIGLTATYGFRPRTWPAELGFRAPFRPALVVGAVVALTSAVLLWAHGEPLERSWLFGLEERGFFGALPGSLGLWLFPLTRPLLAVGYVFRQLHRRAGWSFASAMAVLLLVSWGSTVLAELLLLGTVVPSLWVGLVYVAVSSAAAAWLFVLWQDNFWVIVAATLLPGVVAVLLGRTSAGDDLGFIAWSSLPVAAALATTLLIRRRRAAEAAA